MFNRKQYTDIMQKLTDLQDAIAANNRRISDLEARLDDFQSDDTDEPKDISTDVSELKQAMQANNEFMQNIIFKLIDNNTGKLADNVVKNTNGRITMEEYIKNKNSGAVKLPG